MFNLEQSICKWRQQMLAAGIKSPVPMEELENHLREEIERHLKSGTSLQEAFTISTRAVGSANVLKSEFRKIRETTATNRILALLWLAGCLWSLNTMRHQFTGGQLWEDRRLFFMNSLVTLIYLTGVFGSVLLFRGAKIGINIVCVLALLFLTACVAQFAVNFGAPIKWEIWWVACAVFCIVSIWQLHLPKNLKPAV